MRDVKPLRILVRLRRFGFCRRKLLSIISARGDLVKPWLTNITSCVFAVNQLLVEKEKLLKRVVPMVSEVWKNDDDAVSRGCPSIQARPRRLQQERRVAATRTDLQRRVAVARSDRHGRAVVTPTD